jgi:outer membrane protein assembly factor BamB
MRVMREIPWGPWIRPLGYWAVLMLALYFTSICMMVILRADDGQLLWHTRHANRFRENCEIPQYADGMLYVASGYGHGSEGYRISPPAGKALRRGRSRVER